MQRRIELTIKPSSDKNSIAGVNALVTDDYEAAVGHFKQAIAADPSDHRSCFGAGVACEKLGRRDEARKFYKQAKSYDNDDPQYTAAVARVDRM
jgi:Flp pilus assembly protein TadD